MVTRAGSLARQGTSIPIGRPAPEWYIYPHRPAMADGGSAAARRSERATAGPRVHGAAVRWPGPAPEAQSGSRRRTGAVTAQESGDW